MEKNEVKFPEERKCLLGSMKAFSSYTIGEGLTTCHEA